MEMVSISRRGTLGVVFLVMILLFLMVNVAEATYIPISTNYYDTYGTGSLYQGMKEEGSGYLKAKLTVYVPADADTVAIYLPLSKNYNYCAMSWYAISDSDSVYVGIDYGYCETTSSSPSVKWIDVLQDSTIYWYKDVKSAKFLKPPNVGFSSYLVIRVHGTTRQDDLIIYIEAILRE